MFHSYEWNVNIATIVCRPLMTLERKDSRRLSLRSTEMAADAGRHNNRKG